MTVLQQVFKALIGTGSGKKPSLDGLLAKYDRELENFSSLVEPAPQARPRTPFDSPNLTFDQMYMAHLSARQMLSLMRVMIPMQLQMRYSASLYDGKFQPAKSEASPEFLAELEHLAHESGAADIKYIRVPRNAIFKHKGIPYEYAVVITVEMDQHNMSTAPSFEAMREVVKGYGNLARIGNRLARFMRRSGFAAYPGTALGGLTDYCHLAELAGLGAIGYHGLLITPKEGARLRINTIYTNITNLSDQPENEHLWVRDFCAMCKKCIRGCPVKAIYDQPRPRGDGGMQCIDHDACRDYFQQYYGCAICLAKCPFSDVGYETVKARFKGNPRAPQFRIPQTVQGEEP